MKYSLRSLMIVVTVLPVFRESLRGTFGYGHVNLPIRRDQSKTRRDSFVRESQKRPLFSLCGIRVPTGRHKPAESRLEKGSPLAAPGQGFTRRERLSRASKLASSRQRFPRHSPRLSNSLPESGPELTLPYQEVRRRDLKCARFCGEWIRPSGTNQSGIGGSLA